MGTVDSNRQRDALPSIFELDKVKTDRADTSRFTAMNGLNISTAPLGSPTTVYSGPPPPYSYAPSTAASTTGLSGYISPPESTTRRSTRDDKDSPTGRQSLPSIHEALGDKSLPFATPLSATAPQHLGSTPSTAVTQNFPEAPKGPSNPFSQPPPTFRENPFSTQHQPVPPPPPPPPPDLQQNKPTFTPVSSQEPRPPASQSYAQPPSPRSVAPSTLRPSFSAHNDSAASRSPVQAEQPRQSYSFPSLSNHLPAGYTSEPYHFASGSKYQDQRAPFPRGPDLSYGDTVKRHLDVFDAELGLNEIADASHRTLEFSRIWTQRYHQGNRSGFLQDSLPGVHEIDDMMQQSHRVMDNLTRMREVVITQQNALSEHRARMARGSQLEAEYNGIPDEYSGGGFAGGDAKKRRGKAAPPGRCHSCNRAETPEWRRGPDGARTLCNACGLHYAKLTRKMGVSKAAALTGSNLRPKSLDQRP